MLSAESISDREIPSYDSYLGVFVTFGTIGFKSSTVSEFWYLPGTDVSVLVLSLV